MNLYKNKSTVYIISNKNRFFVRKGNPDHVESRALRDGIDGTNPCVSAVETEKRQIRRDGGRRCGKPQKGKGALRSPNLFHRESHDREGKTRRGPDLPSDHAPHGNSGDGAGSGDARFLRKTDVAFRGTMQSHDENSEAAEKSTCDRSGPPVQTGIHLPEGCGPVGQIREA